MNDYQFTTKWFERDAKPVWQQLLPTIRPRRILEIGSFEGASTCFMVDMLAKFHPLEVHCIDTWEGGVEHLPGGSAQVDMTRVEARFRSNVDLAISRATHPVNLVVHKGYSDDQLTRLLVEGHRGGFDFIYVDGSHQAFDVLCDAVLCFRLLKVGGLMVFDDYLWSEDLPYGQDLLRCPKPAIDAFVNLYARKLKVLRAPLYQLFVRKSAE